MKKIYVLRHWYDNEDNSGGEVIAASDNLHTLNSIMRDSVKRSGVLDEEEIEWDEDDTEFLTDDPNQMYVCYSFYCSPCNYAKAVWEITEVEVK